MRIALNDEAALLAREITKGARVHETGSVLVT